MHDDITINHESQTSICSDHHAWFSSVSFRSISANLTLIQKHKETHLVMTDIQYGEKMQRTMHGVTCSPLSPGIPGIPREPTIAGPGGPLSPYNKYSIRHIWWTNHGSLCIWISVSCSAIQEQHCTAADSAAPNQYKTYHRKKKKRNR